MTSADFQVLLSSPDLMLDLNQRVDYLGFPVVEALPEIDIEIRIKEYWVASTTNLPCPLYSIDTDNNEVTF